MRDAMQLFIYTSEQPNRGFSLFAIPRGLQEDIETEMHKSQTCQHDPMSTSETWIHLHACLFLLASSNQQMSGFQALDYSLMPRRLSSVFKSVIARDAWAISSVASLCIRLKSASASTPTECFSSNLRRALAFCLRLVRLTSSHASSSVDFARCGWLG